MPKNLFEYKIKCYFCNKVLVYTIKNKIHAISDARKKGWKFGKHITCSDCKKRPKNELYKIISDKFFNLKIKI